MATHPALIRLHSRLSSPSLFSSQLQPIRSSAPSRASITLRAVATLVPEKFTTIPMFDVFDAPPRLCGCTQIHSMTDIRRQQQQTEISPDFDPSLPRPPPSILPAPIIFDGPARPRNLPHKFQRRVPPTLSSVPGQSRRHHVPSEPSIEIFEGPARLTRHSHHFSGRYGVSPSHSDIEWGTDDWSLIQDNGVRFLFFGLAGTVGGVLFLAKDDSVTLPSANCFPA